MSYTTPIKAGEVIYTIRGYDNSSGNDAECVCTCETDILFGYITGSCTNMNSLGIGFCALANDGNTNKTVKISWKKTIFEKDGTTTVTTTSDSYTGGSGSSTNEKTLAWYRTTGATGNPSRFQIACLEPLNSITNFVNYSSTTQKMAKDFILNKYQQETDDTRGLNMFCSLLTHAGGTYIWASTERKATINFNPKLFIDLTGFLNSEIGSGGSYEHNASALQNIPLTNFFANGPDTYSLDKSNFTSAYLLYYGLTIQTDRFMFDVYLDGANEPRIGVTWRKISASGDWNGQLTDAQLWLYTNNSAYRLTDGTPPYPQVLYYPVSGINIPNMGNTDDNGNNYNAFSIDVEKPFDKAPYDITWLSADANIWGGVSKIEKFLQQGVGGTDTIYLLLRFKYRLLNENDDGWTDLHIVTIPKELPDSPSDITVARVASSNYLISWNVDVTVHYGEMPEDVDPRDPSDPSDPSDPYDPYDPYDPPNPTDFDFGDGTITSGMLTTTYAMSETRLQALGQKLWTQSYFDVLKVQTNPIENIISVKAFPFDITGTEKDIVIGDVPMGVNGLMCNDTKRIVVGNGVVTGFYNNFLDFAPFTSLTIFLPYIGFKELDLSKLVNTTLEVIYICDFITGACKAILTSNNLPVYEFDGTMGIDVPLTSSDRAQTDIKHLQNVVNGSAQLLNKDILGATNTALSSAQMQYTSDTTSGGSPSCASYSCRNVYLIYNRPYFDNIRTFNHVYGRASKQSATLSELRGFTMLNRDVDLTSIPCLQSESDMLRDLLSNGVYL